MDKLISKKNTYLKSTICKNSSLPKHKNEKYSRSKENSKFHLTYNSNSTINYLLLIFTVFSIILTIGTQPIIQTNLAFAQSDLSSRSSDSKLQVNSKDPFDFSGNNVKKESENIIIPDIVGPDNESDMGSSSTTPPQSQSQSQSNSQSANPTYHDNNNVGKGNPHSNEMIETDDISGTELASSQMDTSNSNTINNNTNEEGIEEVIELDDQSSSAQSESATNPQFQPQSKNAHPMYYKSYRDYMEKNNLYPNSYINGTDNAQGAELSSNSEMETYNSNTININKNTNDVDLIVPDDKLESLDELSSDDKSATEFSSSSVASSEVSTQASNEIYGDFNGDGFDDLAIGVQREDVDTGAGTIVDAGAVNVLYGSTSGLSATSPRPDQIWTQDSPDVNDAAQEGDQFGASLSAGDFNGDGIDDLAIGVTLEDVDTAAGPQSDAGAVNVLYGSSNGLSATSPRPDQIWTQDSPYVNDAAQEDDLFGNSLTAGDFNGDGRDDLAIGVFREDVSTAAGPQSDAGAVNVLYGSTSGLSATSPRPDQFWHQSITDVNDLAEFEDLFGASVSAGDFDGDGIDDLAIGLRGEDVDTSAGPQSDAGAVNVLYGSSNGLSATSTRPDQFWTQDSANVNDVVESGDVFGASLASGDFNSDGRDDLAIGVNFEDVVVNSVDVSRAGAVNILHGSTSGLSATSPRPDQIWTQDTPSVNDVPEDNDELGFSLSSGDFNGDGSDDLAVGVRLEGVDTSAGPQSNAGAVNVLYGSSNGLSATSPRPDQIWTQDTPDVNDASESSDVFGNSLSAGDFNGDGRDDLAIGVPNEDVVVSAVDIMNSGAVNVIYGSSNGLSATSPRPDQFWHQSITDVNDLAEIADNFGLALG